MEQTYRYQIGILYFSDNLKRIQKTLVGMLKTDGYQVEVWCPAKDRGEDENAIYLYDFIRNQCEHTVLIATPRDYKELLFLQAFQTEVQQKKTDRDRSFLVIECGEELPLALRMQATCLDGSAACSAELAIQIEDFFYPQKVKKKEIDRDFTSQNIVVAGTIKNSKFF